MDDSLVGPKYSGDTHRPRLRHDRVLESNYLGRGRVSRAVIKEKLGILFVSLLEIHFDPMPSRLIVLVSVENESDVGLAVT